MIFRITGTVIHHTKDKFCVSCDVAKRIEPFLIDGNDHGITTIEEAEVIARKIICPFDFDYESVTADIHANIAFVIPD